MKLLIYKLLIFVIASFLLGRACYSSDDYIKDLEKEFTYNNVTQAGEPKKEITDTTLLKYHEYRMRQLDYTLYECSALIAMLPIALFIVLWFVTKKTSYTAASIVNASGLIFIIFGTIFIVILSDVESQLTAAMGIIGAVAGYLFGTMRKGEGGEVAEGKR